MECRSQVSPESYQDYVNIIKTDDISFPIAISDIGKLEMINRSAKPPLKFSVNVFREDLSRGSVHMVRKSPYRDGKIVNVLLVDFNLRDEKENFSHYILIEGYSFFKKRYHDPKTKRLTSLASTIFCDKYFDHFRSDRQLQIHRESCGNESCVIDFPKETEKLQFTKTEYGFKRIYNGYADFESITEKTQNIAECSICKSNESKITCQHSYAVSLSSHKPVSVSLVVIDRNGKMVHEYFYSGEDVIEKFVNEVLELEKNF